MTLEQILAEFKGLDFEQIQSQYPESFHKVYQTQKEWLCPVEEKNALPRFAHLAPIIREVIAKLKDSQYVFELDDVELLNGFTNKIHQITRAGNFLNNFKHGAIFRGAGQLDLVGLFNKVKHSQSAYELESKTGLRLHAHIDNLFAVVKHCQNPLDFPVNYVFWRNMARAIYGIPGKYDALCNFYRTWPAKERHLNFGTGMGALATEIAQRFNGSAAPKVQDGKLYKQVYKLFHIKDYTKLLQVELDYRAQLLADFEIWLKESYLTKQNEPLSEKSIVNSIDAIKAVDRDFIELGIFSEGLLSQPAIDNLDQLTNTYKQTGKYSERNQKGNNMYGSALSQFLSFQDKSNFETEQTPAAMNKSPLNLILYGPPGTGKTYYTINKALMALGEETKGINRAELKRKYDRYVQQRRIVFTTFHQSMGYEDFVEGIKPLAPSSETSPIQYKIKDGIFKEIAIRARQTENKTIEFDGQRSELTKDVFKELYRSFADALPDIKEKTSTMVLDTKEKSQFWLFRNSAGSISIRPVNGKTDMSAALNELEAVLFDGKVPTFKSYEQPIIDKILSEQDITSEKIDKAHNNYVIIIDEINRGNVSQIFGELITLIETDKREKINANSELSSETLKVTLPYSQLEFSVPDNLYIIGTMNTADRSVEALDSALRRRFVFEEMAPKPGMITGIREQKGLSGKIGQFDLGNLLGTLNHRIEKLLDRDHVIGHSYFLECENMEELRATFYKNIIPLLQEYFFGDYAKIGLVLGAGFVQVKPQEVAFAEHFDHEGFDIFNERKVYQIVDYPDARSLTEIIYAKAKTSISFEQALSVLLNQNPINGAGEK